MLQVDYFSPVSILIVLGSGAAFGVASRRCEAVSWRQATVVYVVQVLVATPGYFFMVEGPLQGQADIVAYHDEAVRGTWGALLANRAAVPLALKASYVALGPNPLAISIITSTLVALARLDLADRAQRHSLRPLARYLVASPLISFFLSVAGKDGAVFVGLTLLTAQERRLQSRLFGLLTVLVFRPHVALLCLPLFLLRVDRAGRMRLLNAAGGFVLCVVVALGSTSLLASSGNAVTMDPGSLIARLEVQSENLSVGTLAPEWYRNAPLLFRSLLVPIRPFLKLDPVVLLASLDACWLARSLWRSSIRSVHFKRAWPAVVHLGLLILLLSYYPNEGLVARQKSMLVPALVALSVAAELRPGREAPSGRPATYAQV